MKLYRRDFLRASAVVAAKLILPDKSASAMSDLRLGNIYGKNFQSELLAKPAEKFRSSLLAVSLL